MLWLTHFCFHELIWFNWTWTLYKVTEYLHKMLQLKINIMFMDQTPFLRKKLTIWVEFIEKYVIYILVRLD